MAMMSMLLTACSDAPTPNVIAEKPLIAEALKDAPVIHIVLQEVVDTYVLGGTRTDLQREAMTTKLVGATVSWRFKVYDIAKDNAVGRISKLLSAKTTPDNEKSPKITKK